MGESGRKLEKIVWWGTSLFLLFTKHYCDDEIK
jgi:hypothetical protein